MEPYSKLTMKELDAILASLLTKKTKNNSSSSRTNGRKRSSDLLEQLQIHQLELEMKNRELLESHQALEGSRSRYADLYDTAPLGYLTLDQIGCIVEMNLTGASMLGLEPSRLKGRPFASYVSPQDISVFLNHISQCLSSRQGVTTEITLLPRKGGSIPVQLISQAYTDPERHVTVCRTALVDLTDRKRSEEQIRFQALLLDQVGSAVIAIDLNGKIVLWNKFSEKLYQWKKEEALGQDVIELLVPEKSRGVAEEIHASLMESGHWEGELFLQRRDGSTFPGYFHNTAVRGIDGERIGFVGVIQDISERKRSEEQLRQSEERFRQLAENINEVFFLTDFPITSMVYVSPAYERVWGRSCQSLYDDPRSWLDSVDREDRPRLEKLLRENQESFQIEYRVIRPDGATRWIWARTFPIQDRSGATYRLAGIAEDITERKAAEERLRISEERFRRYFDLGLIGMVITSPTKGWIEVNDQICEILGYERSELLQKSWADLTHPDDLAADAAEFNRVLAGEIDGYSMEKRFIRKDGRVIDAAISVKCLRRTDRSVDYFVGLLQDITEQRKFERRLRYQANLLTHIHDAIIATDDRFQVTAWNPAAERIYGWSAEEVLGRKVQEVIRSESTEIQQSEALQALAESGSYEVEAIQYRKDGRRLYIHRHTIVLRDEAGRISGYVSTNRDITERRQAEQALGTAERFSENLIQTANVMILSLDSDGQIDIFNKAAEKVTGYTRSELRGKSWFEILVPKEKYPAVWEEFNRLMDGGIPKSFENPILTKTGEERYIIWRNNQIKVNGKVIATISFGNDITERREMEEALRRSEERFQLASRATSDAIWDRDLLKNTFWWSENFKVLFCYRNEQVSPECEWWAARIHPEDREQVLSNVDAAIQNGERFWFGEYRLLRGDGCYSTISDSGYIIRDERGRAIRMIGAMVDITKRKQTEKELADNNRRLQLLSGRLLVAHETERGRIARELHDEIGQCLTVVIFQLKAARRHPDLATSRLEECIQVTENALEAVRNLSLNLHPPQIDQLGLIAALRWHLDRQRQSSNLSIRFLADPLPARLHPNIEIACFRVVQEALTNIIRHAQATRVSVELYEDGAELHLTISDDGRGFDAGAAQDCVVNGASLGLVGMQERTELAGGRLELNSSPGKGTQVHAVFPLTYSGLLSMGRGE